jgi:hypothetical protein
MTSGILRSESLYQAELSDFIGVTMDDKQRDIYPIFIMVNQIAIDKTNHGRTLYGRATRYKGMLLCCIGALASYLQLRIFLTGELRSFLPEEWLENRNWFEIDVRKLGGVTNCPYVNFRVWKQLNIEPIANFKSFFRQSDRTSPDKNMRNWR